MNISELVDILVKVREEKGDLDVEVADEAGDFHEIVPRMVYPCLKGSLIINIDPLVRKGEG